LSELFVEKTVGNSPAARAGIQRGDRLVSVNGERLTSFFDLREKVQKFGDSGKPVQIEWERPATTSSAGVLTKADVSPNVTEVRDPELKKTRQYTIGVYPMLTMALPPMVIERTLNPLLVVGNGVARMATMTWRNFVSIGKMFTGGVSVKTLGGRS
jgi:membrane-associated protease RseP (regulator of RpoE activity)